MALNVEVIIDRCIRTNVAMPLKQHIWQHLKGRQRELRNLYNSMSDAEVKADPLTSPHGLLRSVQLKRTYAQRHGASHVLL